MGEKDSVEIREVVVGFLEEGCRVCTLSVIGKLPARK
jgi:hypothetical protein